MKQLLLLRHGKSDWNKPGQDDRERPLAQRGRTAARDIATWLDGRGMHPDVALVSTARRTQETWQLVQENLGPVEPTHPSDALYLASPGEILDQLARVDDKYVRTIVVGHNPGLEALSHMLAGPGSDPAALADLQRGFPTAGLAVFTLNGDRWADLAADGAQLSHFVRPREIA